MNIKIHLPFTDVSFDNDVERTSLEFRCSLVSVGNGSATVGMVTTGSDGSMISTVILESPGFTADSDVSAGGIACVALSIAVGRLSSSPLDG